MPLHFACCAPYAAASPTLCRASCTCAWLLAAPACTLAHAPFLHTLPATRYTPLPRCLPAHHCLRHAHTTYPRPCNLPHTPPTHYTAPCHACLTSPALPAPPAPRVALLPGTHSSLLYASLPGVQTSARCSMIPPYKPLPAGTFALFFNAAYRRPAARDLYAFTYPGRTGGALYLAFCGL